MEKRKMYYNNRKINLYSLAGILFLSIILWSCKQEISIKKGRFTAVNPVSYTDVIYKADRDTVFVSGFDGKIHEVIKSETKQQQIAAIGDEIYAMAYDKRKSRLYAATLNSGIVVVNTKDGSVVKQLPLKNTWAKQLTYNSHNGILATYDFKGYHYVWNTNEDFNAIETPKVLQGTRPRYIRDNGDIFFDGKQGVIVWNYKTKTIIQKNKTSGHLIDVDDQNNYLMLSGKEFSFFDTKADSIVYSQKHPDWPIYVADKDTTVKVPLHLEIISGIITTYTIYTCGLDKSLRKWDKQSGELMNTYLLSKNTPSAMDIAKDGGQLVIVDLGGNIQFQEL